MIKTCPVCGKEFEDKKHKNRIYCSKKCSSEKRKISIVGQKFNRLLVLKEIQTNYKGVYYLCKCDCGNKKIIRGNHLRHGKILSCGCLKKEIASKIHITHNLSHSRIYSIYKDIIKRCLNKNHHTYKNYGNRGIKICDEWKNNFKDFYDWAMENGYQDDLTIDRIDNNGNYEPSNCRWVDKLIQANNTRNNHFLTYNNETKTIAQWGRELNINPTKISKRINYYKWSVERALTTP